MLPQLSVSTLASTQGGLVDFSSSLSPYYAKLNMSDSPFSFLPALMDEAHKRNVE